MKKTAQFGLNQWEMSDRIQMDDFNADNAIIDAALAKRNCRIYFASYVGDGNATKTWTFPAKPVLVHLIGDRHSIMFRSAPVGMTQSGQTTSFLQVTWGENSVTWTNANNSGFISNNGTGDKCGIFAILESD